MMMALRCPKKYGELMIKIFAITTLLVEIVGVTSIYVPDIGYPIGANSRGFKHQVSLSRRQDSDDEDDMDSNASAPYQNQGGDTNGRQSDGYEENEADGPYGETPRDEEGQADLERFFDDHLGASEREGMDKENLPSNIVEQISLPSHRYPMQLIHYGSFALPESMALKHPMVAQASKSFASYSPEFSESVKVRHSRLPNDRMIIYHQEPRDDPIHNEDKGIATTRGQRGQSNFGDRIVATENDDMDKVYVTRTLDKPFKIEDLGGYDPEQDFQDAERDMTNDQTARSSRRGSQEEGGSSPSAREVNFNDGDTDSMFNDASETDEITFAQDDPYQTDLEAEMRSQAFDKPTAAAVREAEPEARIEVAPEVRIAPRRMSSGPQQEDSEGSWINDGADEMDIPSQSHQDRVLEKAAKEQEAADIAARNDDQSSAVGPDDKNQDESGAEGVASDNQDGSSGEEDS